MQEFGIVVLMVMVFTSLMYEVTVSAELPHYESETMGRTIAFTSQLNTGGCLEITRAGGEWYTKFGDDPTCYSTEELTEYEQQKAKIDRLYAEAIVRNPKKERKIQKEWDLMVETTTTKLHLKELQANILTLNMDRSF